MYSKLNYGDREFILVSLEWSRDGEKIITKINGYLHLNHHLSVLSHRSENMISNEISNLKIKFKFKNNVKNSSIILD